MNLARRSISLAARIFSPSSKSILAPLKVAMTEVTKSETTVVEILQKHEQGVRPAHHMNDTQTRFGNPWPSFRTALVTDHISYMSSMLFLGGPKPPADIATRIPSQVPTWGVDGDPSTVKATWLGHAAFFVEMPTPEGASRGPRVVFDPALSNRCFSSNYMGPIRHLPIPCPVKDLPVIDAIVLSHNHYDHTDSDTLTALTALHHPHVFAPLGNAPYLASLGIPPSHIHTLDWWDAALVSVPLPGTAAPAQLRLTCTPAQHLSSRTPFDRFHTLWASWALQSAGKRVWFAGDTAYRTVRAGEDEDAVPVCPAFKEIGERLGPFDLAMLPIGAYNPRALFSNVHSSPSDSVRIFQDVRAKKALAMHWGTWTLTLESVMEPPKLLEEECVKAGLEDGVFDICGLGETRYF